MSAGPEDRSGARGAGAFSRRIDRISRQDWAEPPAAAIRRRSIRPMNDGDVKATTRQDAAATAATKAHGPEGEKSGWSTTPRYCNGGGASMLRLHGCPVADASRADGHGAYR